MKCIYKMWFNFISSFKRGKLFPLTSPLLNLTHTHTNTLNLISEYKFTVANDMAMIVMCHRNAAMLRYIKINEFHLCMLEWVQSSSDKPVAQAVKSRGVKPFNKPMASTCHTITPVGEWQQSSNILS